MGPLSSVKEQVAGVYACSLAARGFVAIAFDPRFFGESGGEPRQYESWRAKVRDIQGALKVLETHPAVDAHRLSVVGVCLGAGHAAWSAVADPRVRALGLVAGEYRDASELRAENPRSFLHSVEVGRRAREHYERTGQVLTVPAASRTGLSALQRTDAASYFGTWRGAVSNYVNLLALMSWETLLPFDVITAARHVVVPTTLVHGTRAANPRWAHSFYEGLSAPKSFRMLESSDQCTFYDEPGMVDVAADIVAAHLTKALDTHA